MTYGGGDGPDVLRDRGGARPTDGRRVREAQAAAATQMHSDLSVRTEPTSSSPADLARGTIAVLDCRYTDTAHRATGSGLILL